MTKTYFTKIGILCALITLLLIGVNSVFGVRGAGITVGPSARMNVSNSTDGTLYTAQAGNVTQIDISGKTITTHWAGFYGNISGNLTLEDSAGRVFYDWAGVGVPRGEVLASNTSTISWSGVKCANSTVIAAINTALGMTATSTDTVNLTYAGNTHPGFSVGGVAIGQNACNATNAYTDSGKNAQFFYQILLQDANNAPIYTTLINDSTTSFQGYQQDFELLVGAGGASTNLYFFLELD